MPRIIIVEDEGIEALDLQQRLTAMGYEVVDIADTGEEAVRKAEETAPDLMLMDIMLRGEMDGVAAAQQIHTRWGIPVIYLTAYADEDTLQRAKVAEPYGYIIKPFRERELHITIDMALYKHQMEKKLKENELWQVAKMATMGELVATVAHELNNPLTTAGLRLESLAGQIPAGDPKQGSLRAVVREIGRMAALVKNLLDFTHGRERHVSDTDIPRTLDYALDVMAHQWRRGHIAVRRDYQPGLPPVPADRQEMLQLFLNILTNACDAMPAGGTLFVQSYTAEAAYISIDIADTGSGIAPDHLPKVMDRFFTTKPIGKGTGLGLSICRRIVREHRGSIEIASEPGAGTTVSLKLPVGPNIQAPVPGALY